MSGAAAEQTGGTAAQSSLQDAVIMQQRCGSADQQPAEDAAGLQAEKRRPQGRQAAGAAAQPAGLASDSTAQLPEQVNVLPASAACSLRAAACKSQSSLICACLWLCKSRVSFSSAALPVGGGQRRLCCLPRRCARGAVLALRPPEHVRRLRCAGLPGDASAVPCVPRACGEHPHC